MPDITVATPQVGQEAYFSFKEPFATFIRNNNNLSNTYLKLKVSSVITMSDMIRNDLRDPFTLLYEPAGIGEPSYKQDLIDHIPIISFSYRTRKGVEKFFRVPLNYVSDISDVTNVPYLNRHLIIDLNRLPESLDVSSVYSELVDFIRTRTGVVPVITDVSTGDVLMIDTNEHSLREQVRMNNASVYKTLEIQHEELKLKYDQIISRLNNLGIILS